jgi:hypothetical protein
VENTPYVDNAPNPLKTAFFALFSRFPGAEKPHQLDRRARIPFWVSGFSYTFLKKHWHHPRNRPTLSMPKFFYHAIDPYQAAQFPLTTVY